MSRSRSRKRLFRTLPRVALLTALLLALLMVGGVQQAPEDGSGEFMYDSYIWVLVITVAALVVLLWSIADRILTLVRNIRNEVPGALLAARWVRYFLLMSLPPALIVFFFSAWFLNSTIDSWFDVRVEAALADSLQLGQDFLGVRTLEVRNQSREIADTLSGLPEDGEMLRRALLSRVRAAGPVELTVLETSGTLVATASINALSGPPGRPGDFAALQAIDQGEYAAVEPIDGDRLQIRVLQLMPAAYPGASPRLLQAIYPLPPDLTALTGSIESEYRRYQNVSYLRQSLKQSFLLILTLVLFLTVLLAILAALNSARRMVTPLSKLSSATREVAAGDFDKRVEAGGRDEIGFLVTSFNEMTGALESASQAAEESRAELQAQGEYLETVLGNLSSGVITLDNRQRVITANAACRAILNLPAEMGNARMSLISLGNDNPALLPFAEAVNRQVNRGRNSWQQEIRLDHSPQFADPAQTHPLVLLVRGTRLPLIVPGSDEAVEGHVIVFDDVTILNQAQREAAWSEVARRLAHEVKNPLTPIRLAAERLSMKLGGQLGDDQNRLVERVSTTIVAQVEALRKLVDAFGDYASEPELKREPIELDALIRDVVSLYRQGNTQLNFELDLQQSEHPAAVLHADSGRIRQLLHNLIRNAQEAAGTEGAQIAISTRLVNEQQLQLQIQDGGPGFPESILEHPFEPYVSHKPGGSGLGLAICRKIVDEHDGEIRLGNRSDGGASVIITLPMTTALGRPGALE